jgi:outer membrane lipoprotein-sorting protein
MTRSAHAAESPEALLRKADAIRNPGETYKMAIRVKSPDQEQKLEVFLKGPLKTLIVTKAPAKDIGRNMLMLDRDFYAYVPNLKRSLRLSLAQKLNGQVANGDISRTRWAGDYRAEAGPVTPDGKVSELVLTGLKDNLTYQRIRLWLETSTARPLRAHYLSTDGRTLLKEAFFEGYRLLAGRERPTHIRIKDTTGAASEINIESMEVTDLPDSFFTDRSMESRR